MPRKANSDLGTCPCPGHGCTAVVPVRRQGAAGPLYLYCNNKDTCAGTKHFNQKYIMDSATMTGRPALVPEKEKPVKIAPVEVVPPVKTTAIKKPRIVREKVTEKTHKPNPATVGGVGGWFETLLD